MGRRDIDFKTQPCQSFAYSGTNLRLVLADARRDIKTAERRRQPRHLAGDAKGKDVNSFTRFGAITRQKIAAVGADPRETQKAGLVIENIFRKAALKSPFDRSSSSAKTYAAVIASADPWPARRDTQNAASPTRPTRPRDQVSILI
jgi:hypothetical protein